MLLYFPYKHKIQLYATPDVGHYCHDYKRDHLIAMIYNLSRKILRNNKSNIDNSHKIGNYELKKFCTELSLRHKNSLKA